MSEQHKRDSVGSPAGCSAPQNCCTGKVNDPFYAWQFVILAPEHRSHMRQGRVIGIQMHFVLRQHMKMSKIYKWKKRSIAVIFSEVYPAPGVLC